MRPLGFRARSPGERYKAALAHELRYRGLRVEAEVPVPVIYDGVNLGVGFRIDQLVEGRVIVEAQAVMRMTDLHDAQTISHLVLSKHRLALRINFNVRRLKQGIRRFVNNLSLPIRPVLLPAAGQLSLVLRVYFAPSAVKAFFNLPG
jgi:GxxExxY protein